MGKIGSIFFAAAISMATAAGCGSSSSGDAAGGGGAGAPPDFASLQTTLTTPTGTFAAGTEASVIDGYTKKTASMTNGLSFLGGDKSTTTKSFGIVPQSLHILAGSCDSIKTATGAGSCTCPSGGSVSYELPPGGMEVLNGKGDTPIDATVAIKADACADNGKVVDGGLYIKVKKTDAKTVFLIYAIHLKVTGGDKPGQYDVDVLFDTKDGKSKIVFAVDVPDGKVLVSGSYDANTGNGSITIEDKSGVYTCTAAAGVGSCTGPGGVKRDGIHFKL